MCSCQLERAEYRKLPGYVVGDCAENMKKQGVKTVGMKHLCSSLWWELLRCRPARVPGDRCS